MLLAHRSTYLRLVAVEAEAKPSATNVRSNPWVRPCSFPTKVHVRLRTQLVPSARQMCSICSICSRLVAEIPSIPRSPTSKYAYHS
jgi:hypothetical protein